eukprot:gi/632983085/ref/XP_007908473.1/ PREDICTED: active regulator of SIRT1 [Callorhinchus milii]
MSASLVRKGLELLGQETRGKSDMTVKRKVACGRTGTDRTGLRTTGKRGVKKQRQRLHAQKKKVKSTVKGKVVKSALEEYRKRQGTDHTEDNLRYMLGVSSQTESSITRQILNYNRGRKARDLPEEEKAKKEEKSVFSEKDFRTFEKEYFGNPQ